jgi:hypothetical protein
MGKHMHRLIVEILHPKRIWWALDSKETVIMVEMHGQNARCG